MHAILKHASILNKDGWDVDLILPNVIINIISLNNVIIVATLYTTLNSALSYYKAKKHLYLVQNYETDFNYYGSHFRQLAEKAYKMPFNIQFVTISKWCESLLWKKYKKIQNIYLMV